MNDFSCGNEPSGHTCRESLVLLDILANDAKGTKRQWRLSDMDRNIIQTKDTNGGRLKW